MKRYLLGLLVLLLVGLTLAGFDARAGALACARGTQAQVSEVTLEHGQGEIVMLNFPRPFCTVPVVVVTGYEEVTRVRLGVVTAEAVTLIVDGAPGAVRLAWQGTPATKE